MQEEGGLQEPPSEQTQRHACCTDELLQRRQRPRGWVRRQELLEQAIVQEPGVPASIGVMQEGRGRRWGERCGHEEGS